MTAVVEVPYSPFRNPVDGRVYPTPMLRLWLLDRAGERRVQVQGHIDTGSPTSSFPPALMAELGIAAQELEPRRSKGTAPGEYDTLSGRTDLVAELDVPGRPGAAWRFELACRFQPEDGIGVPLLGRMDFLQTFRLDLVERNEVFFLEPYPDTEIVERS